MSANIIHKKSSVQGKIPATSALSYGELAVNTYDGKIYFKYNFGLGDAIATISQVTDSSIGDLSDVNLSTAPTNGQVLKWNGTNWIAADDIDTTLTLSSENLSALGDVSSTSPSDGQSLVWNASTSLWEPATVTSGGSSSTTYAEQSVVSDTFTGDNSTTDYTVSLLPDSEDHVMVMLNGVVQDPSTYSLASDVITFATAPATGDNIELRTFSGFSTDVQLNNYQSYVYTLTSDGNTVSGSDDNSNTLAYTANKVEVYVNGVRLVDGDDYAATNGTSITFNETIFSGSVVEVVSLATASLINQALEIQTNEQVLTTTATDQAVETYSASDYRTGKFLIQMSHATAGYSAAEVLLTHDGSSAYYTVYGEIYSTASLGSISADLNGGQVRLLVSPTNTNTTVKVKRITVEA